MLVSSGAGDCLGKMLPFLKSGIWCVLVKRGAVSDGVEWVS